MARQGRLSPGKSLRHGCQVKQPALDRARKCCCALMVATLAALIGGPLCSVNASAEESSIRAESSTPAEVQLIVESKPAQRSRIRHKSTAIYQSGDKMDWNCRATGLSEYRDQPIVFQYSFVRVSHGHQVMTGRRDRTVNANGEIDAWTIDDLAPQLPGVYEFQATVSVPGRRPWTRLRSTPSIASANETFLVVRSAEQPLSIDSAPWRSIGEIRPADETLSISNWVPKRAARLIPGLRQTSGDLKRGKHDGSRVSLLQAKSVFQATLPVLAVGYPHLITIRYPSEQRSALRVDLGKGDDQASAAMSIELPTSDELGSSFHDRPNWIEQTFVYFPNGDDQIWISNPTESGTLSFESINVQAGPSRFALPSSEPAAPNRTWLSVLTKDWTTEVTPDWKPKSNDATEESWQLHRNWTAVDRLSQYASLKACGGVVIPDTSDSGDRSRLMAMLSHFQVPALMAPARNPSGQTRISIDDARGFVKDFLDESVVHGFVFPTIETTSGINNRQNNIGDKNSSETNNIHSDALQTLRESFPDRLFFAESRNTKRRQVWMRESNPSASVVLQTLSDADPQHFIQTVDFRSARLDRKAWRLIREFDGRLTGDEASALNSTMAVPSSDLQNQTAIVRVSQSKDRPNDDSDGSTIMTIVNLAPWESNVRVSSTKDESVDWKIVPGPRINIELPVSPDQRTGVINSDNESGWKIPARDTITLTTSQPVDVNALTWTAGVVGGQATIASIKQSVTSVVERIGVLNLPVDSGDLSNGSFENDGEIGLVGWLHAQHPPNCVVIDKETASDGSQSICLTSVAGSNSKTWIVSETMIPPTSGRLAVSMACRAMLATAPSTVQPPSPTLAGQAAAMHVVRVSIEATQNGEPIRWSEQVEVPRSGNWQPRKIVLELDQLVAENLNSMRLTIDSMSAGKVWVDDVQLHNDFPTAKERSELQSQAFLAVQGLQRGQLTPSARLLSNPLATKLLRSLSKHTHLDDETRMSIQSTAVENAASSHATSDDRSEDPPSVTERVKSWLPKPLRF